MLYVVPNYEFLSIDEEGNCYSSHTGRKVKPYVDQDGYFRIKVWEPLERRTRGCYVHRALAVVFIPNPENKPQVNHKDSNRQNNSLENLEWVTEKENYDHGVSHGYIKVGVGEDNRNSLLDENTVRRICEKLEKEISVAQIARDFSIKKPTVFSIRSGQTWGHISKDYNIPPVNKSLSEDDVHQICQHIVKGLSNKEIMTLHHNVNRHHLDNIRNKKTFKHITDLYNW